jgi:hypothetical protein
MSWGVATQNGVSVSLASIVSLSCGATEFSPASLFTSGVQGAWYDPSDINSYMAGLGSELVAPIDFNTGWTASGAAITVNSATSFTAASVANYYIAPFTVGRWYAVTINATFTGSTLNLYNGASAINQITPAGLTSGVSQTFYFLAVATQFNIRQSSAGTVTVNSIAVQEVTSIGNATLFQDSAGTTPVTAVEQPVGLMLDKSQGLVIGSELVPDSSFDTPASWTPETADWVVSGGKATYTKPGAGVQYLQSNDNISIVSGTWYRLTFTISGIASGNAIFGLFNKTASTNYLGGYQTISANGTSSIYFLATSSTTGIRIYGNAGGTATSWSFDSFSIKAIAGNHASQATTASRPVLRARYNLLTYSEQFDNAAWAVVGLARTTNTTIAPDGATTADTITGNSTSNAILYTLGAYTALAGNVTLSWYIKAGTADYAVLSLWQGSGNNGVNLWVNVQTGAVGSNSVTAGYTFVSGSSTAVGSGWYRVVVTGTVPAGSLFFSLRLVDGDNAFAYTNTVGKTLFVWGADLRTGSSAGTYQRIAAATDYATAGFLPYLDLITDDNLATGSIDFSATDAMFVCAGATKNADAASGSVVCELSADINANNGAFTFVQYSNVSGWAYGSKGTTRVNAEPTGQYLGIRTDVLSGISDISTPVVTLRVNGTQAATSSNTQGTGNYGNYPLYIGRRGGSSLPFNGRIFQMIVCGKALSASELASTESFVATKTGVTL